MKEEKIIKGIKKRHQKTYSYLMDVYGKLVYKVVAGILNDQADVEEVCSDVFISLWEYPERYQADKASIKTYLCMIARNKAIDRLRYQNRRQADLLDTEVATEDLEDLVIQKENIQAIKDQIDLMKSPKREVMLLRFFYDLKPKEVALKLSLDLKVVNNMLYNGKKQLKEAIHDLR